METLWKDALWMQFGAAIDVLDQAINACPSALWRGRLWEIPPGHYVPPAFAEFWFQSFHALFWLDLYLTGCREEEFAPPAPFRWAELDSGWAIPKQPYTKQELRAYLASLRQKCHSTLATLTTAQAGRIVAYAWTQGQTVSFLELLLYNMRHVQEHAAQLSLFLGNNGVADEALEAAARARQTADEP